ncbi:MAG: UDP-N-acetylmuramate--L-alanine ligase [Anaerolineae bacterium]|jgi:UDP-N-acetylmuramate--alanine ligase|nr:UDP-N-acetylmuramate--L-alanine ligase [Anaerolineae bacterium]
MPVKRQHIHLIGIGGTGLSAIAKVLLEQGHIVSGSDMYRSPLASSIEKAGATVFIGHDAGNIAGAEVVIVSSAIPKTNPELVGAHEAGIPVYKRSAFLKEWLVGQDCLAVAGTHGKTTTTSMLAWTLDALHKDPSYIIGSVAKNLGTNAHAGKGAYFVIEADEYDYMFHGLRPTVAIVTNMQHDHPDCFHTMNIYRQAFIDFTNQIVPGGHLILCADDVEAAGLHKTIRPDIHVHSYGFSKGADYQITSGPASNTFDFDITHLGEKFTSLHLEIAGQHNALNATAVLATVHQLGLNIDQSTDALAHFQGSERRFDVLGTFNGVTLIDDYAHHPTEIKATLSAARQSFPEARIWVVWQPHTFSRTITLLEQFISAFHDADIVLITDVYAARESNDSFSGQHLADQIQHSNVHFTPGLDDAVNHLSSHTEPGDVVVVCSAGSAISINQQLSKLLDQKGAA